MLNNSACSMQPLAMASYVAWNCPLCTGAVLLTTFNTTTYITMANDTGQTGCVDGIGTSTAWPSSRNHPKFLKGEFLAWQYLHSCQ